MFKKRLVVKEETEEEEDEEEVRNDKSYRSRKTRVTAAFPNRNKRSRKRTGRGKIDGMVWR